MCIVSKVYVVKIARLFANLPSLYSIEQVEYEIQQKRVVRLRVRSSILNFPHEKVLRGQ